MLVLVLGYALQLYESQLCSSQLSWVKAKYIIKWRIVKLKYVWLKPKRQNSELPELILSQHSKKIHEIFLLEDSTLKYLCVYYHSSLFSRAVNKRTHFLLIVASNWAKCLLFFIIFHFIDTKRELLKGCHTNGTCCLFFSLIHLAWAGSF